MFPFFFFFFSILNGYFFSLTLALFRSLSFSLSAYPFILLCTRCINKKEQQIV